MYIDLLGLSGVRIQGGETVILLSPPPVDSELRASRLKADIVVLGKTTDKVNVVPNDGQLFTIKGPGEYEAGGVFFYCLPNPPSGEIKSLLTSLTFENIVVTHLGGLHRALNDEELELFEGTDVLLLPAGGGDVLGAKEAGELVGKLEPKIVIPIHTAKPGLKSAYRDAAYFLKEMGMQASPQEKVKIVKKDLPQEGMEIVYLE